MKLDGVTLIATPKYTHVSRGSSSNHPMAIDFGWFGSENTNQPLYSGIIGAKDVEIARHRYTAGGQGSGATGYVVDIRFETENYTCYRSSMHMSGPSPLPVGTKLKWNTVIGNMGSTGDSTGPHDHVILAICPKGTPVEQMYNHRVEPDKYYHYLNGFTVANDNKLPWVDYPEGGEVVPSPREKMDVIAKDPKIRKEFEMGKKYEVTSIKGDQITLTEIKEGYKVGSKVQVKQSAKNWATGQSIPSWVKGRTYTVKESSNVKTLLGDGINSWINNTDLTQV